MRVITLERKTIDGKPVVYGEGEERKDYQDWWCVIETKEEELLYDKTWNSNECDYIPLWNELVKYAGQGMGVSWGDDDIFGYIRPDSDCPEVGEEFIDGDGDSWERIA